MSYKRIALCLACLLSLCGAARADVIIDWNNVALDVIRENNVSPPHAARLFAILHTSMYDAANAVHRKYEFYRVPAFVRVHTSPTAAAAAAAHRVLTSLFPERSGQFDEYLAGSLSQVPNGPAKLRGVVLGVWVADVILRWRANDHAGDVVPYTPGTGPGLWVPTPPDFKPAALPNWPYVTPFAMTNSSQFRYLGPPALTSKEYAKAVNELKKLGGVNSKVRTEDQTEIAHFWVDNPGSPSPAGRWFLIAQDVAMRHRNTLIENARLFALLAIAECDASIAAWDCKYTYNLWRPITAITEADNDDNPRTKANPNWTPLLVTPNHPECVSGHSTFAGAGSEMLALFFGNDNIGFTLESTSHDASARSYSSFSEAAEEDGRSRIYGGIHFEFSNQAGLASGRGLAQYTFANFLRPR